MKDSKKVYWDDMNNWFFMKNGKLFLDDIHDYNCEWILGLEGRELYIEEESMRKVNKDEARKHLKAGGKVYWGRDEEWLICDGSEVHVEDKGGYVKTFAGGLDLSTGKDLFIKEEVMNRQEALEAICDGKKVNCGRWVGHVGGGSTCTIWKKGRGGDGTHLVGEFTGGGSCSSGGTYSAWHILTTSKELELFKEKPKDETLCELLDVLEGDNGCHSDSRKIKDAMAIIKKKI